MADTPSPVSGRGGSRRLASVDGLRGCAVAAMLWRATGARLLAAGARGVAGCTPTDLARWIAPLAGPWIASLTWAIAFVALWWAIVWAMDRRRRYLKL